MIVDLAFGLNYPFSFLKKYHSNASTAQENIGKRTVIGAFQDKFDAQAALDELEDYGFNSHDISIIVKKDLQMEGKEKGGSISEGAVSGAATGGVLGGLTAFLISVGAVTIPGIGALLIGGPLAAMLGLSGAALTTFSGVATGAMAGGLVGGLIGLGVSEKEAKVYEKKIQQGGVVLAADSNDSSNESNIRQAFEEYDAQQINIIEDSKP